MDNLNYLNFPSIIRDKIETGEFIFPPNTQFSYEPIVAYRGIFRKKDDFSAVSKKDFLSYAELKRRGRNIDETDPHYYGVSLFLNKESVENALNFPKPDKKIAVGYVCQTIGPIEKNKKTGHICWWLYKDVEIEGFSICQEKQK